MDNLLVMILIIVGVALLIAFCMMFYQLSLMKTVKKENYAQNYIKNGSFRLSVSRNIFLFSRVTRTPKPKDNNKK